VLKADSIQRERAAASGGRQDVEEGREALARLREEGKVRWIGVSNFSVAPMTSLQPPYSAVSPEAGAEIFAVLR
jgi:diketogulonate reductase-like aldo/keto reductase